MAPRVQFEPVMVGLYAHAWTVVRVGQDRVGVIRPAGRTRMVFEPERDRAISAAALRNIADMVERLSTERVAHQRAKLMALYLIWVITITSHGRRRKDTLPIGIVLAKTAAAARAEARTKFTLRSNQMAYARRRGPLCKQIHAEIDRAAKFGVTISVTQAYAVVTRPRKRFERHVSTKAKCIERYSPKLAATGAGTL